MSSTTASGSIFDGESSVTHVKDLASKPAKGGTLVVVPLSLLEQWETRFNDHMAPVPSILIYCEFRNLRYASVVNSFLGGNDVSSIDDKTILQYDVILTTYDVLRMEAQRYAITHELLQSTLAPTFGSDFPFWPSPGSW
jgi:SNF2 family DNA or RNA helicase